MTTSRRAFLALTLLIPALTVGCASTGTTDEGDRGRSDLLTREQIMEVEATNLYDVIRRIRPRWLQVRASRSFNMQVEVAVVQNDVYMGAAEVLKEMSPELAYQIQFMDGAKAATAVPGMMSGKHIEGAIIISTRPIGN